MTRRTVPVAALALAAPAAAQSFTSGSSISFALHWSEFNGNNNGVLEPGEGALLSLDVSFTNQNTVATFSPPIGTFGSGTIRGFGSGFIDLIGSATSGNAQGMWNVDQNQGFGVAGDWDLTGGFGNGTPSGMGAGLRSLQFGQFSPEPFVNTTNPIHEIWRGVWTPSSYAQRTVSFAATPAMAAGTTIASVVIRVPNGFVSAFVVPANLIFGSVQIPVVPAPSSVAILVMARAFWRRRRMRGTP